MAFDHSADIFTLKADMDPLGATLLAAAYYCFMHNEAEWWDLDAIPFEDAYSEIAHLGEIDTGDTPPCASGAVACWLLLLMREEVRGG